MSKEEILTVLRNYKLAGEFVYRVRGVVLK